MIEIRKCNKCNVVKNIDEFVLCKNCKGGRSYRCSECDRKAKKEYNKIRSAKYDKIELIDGEDWSSISVNNYYMISSLGRCKRNKSYVKNPIGIFAIKQEHIIALTKNKYGYLMVKLSSNSIGKNYTVHRLVAKAFIPNPQNKPEINHINGIKTDNRVENLEWCTRSENICHAYKIGLNTNIRENGVFSKLNTKQVLEIRRSANTPKLLANTYNVSISAIYLILNRKNWTSI